MWRYFLPAFLFFCGVKNGFQNSANCVCARLSRRPGVHMAEARGYNRHHTSLEEGRKKPGITAAIKTQSLNLLGGRNVGFLQYVSNIWSKVKLKIFSHFLSCCLWPFRCRFRISVTHNCNLSGTDRYDSRLKSDFHILRISSMMYRVFRGLRFQYFCTRGTQRQMLL